MEEGIMKPKRGAINVTTSIFGIAITAASGIGPAQAAFLASGSSGSITVSAGCYGAGLSCDVGGIGNITDTYNDTTGGVGSGVTGNGRIGLMNFVVDADGNTLLLTSYEMDTYQPTPFGDFNTRIVDFSAASGFISDTGDMILDLTGRTAALQFFPLLGENAWNIDNAPVAGTTGMQELFTTGFDDADDPSLPGRQSYLPQTGTSLIGGGGTWTGTLVSSGNFGAAWQAIAGTAYTEKYIITVTGTPAAVPIPAAVWLFGSGALGWMAMARRKKRQR
jgi:hypothetical protein